VNKIETLTGYVEKVMQQEFPKKKLTFWEYVRENSGNRESFVAYFSIDKINEEFAGETLHMFELIWDVAQENKE
jgi:hypothetical protein